VGGAAGTLYAGETYQLQVDFPEHYPMEAPQVIFSSSFFRTNIAPQVSFLHN
jgi:ubiquitin-protein ligase